MTLCRELTKRHEDYKRMTIQELIDYYEGKEVRGECVLVIEGVTFQQLEEEEQKSWENISIEEHMEKDVSQGLSKKDAMKQVAKDRGVGKRDIYQALLD